MSVSSRLAPASDSFDRQSRASFSTRTTGCAAVYMRRIRLGPRERAGAAGMHGHLYAQLCSTGRREARVIGSILRASATVIGIRCMCRYGVRVGILG